MAIFQCDKNPRNLKYVLVQTKKATLSDGFCFKSVLSIELVKHLLR